MLKFLKKLLSFGLGICMLVTGIPKASAEIEVWTFSDNTRITRFNRDDFETMIRLYDYYVQENEKCLFTKGQNITVKVAGICLGICALVGSGILNCANYGNINDEKYIKESVVAGVLGLSGIASIIASFYPEYKKSKVEKDITKKARNEKTSWIGVKDIRDMLIEERDKVEQILRDGFEDRTKAINEIKDNAPELIPLIASGLKREDLQRYPGYYVLIERPYRSDNYVGSDVVIPGLCADYDLRDMFAKDKCYLWIFDLINRLESEGIHGKEYKKILFDGNILKEIEGDGSDFKKNR